MQNISLCLPEDLPVGNTEHHGPSGFCLITPSKLCSMLYLLKMFLISSGVLKAINFLQLKILFSYSVFLILTVNLLKKKKSLTRKKKKQISISGMQMKTQNVSRSRKLSCDYGVLVYLCRPHLYIKYLI